jgi:uncharacterized membrane protein YoaK (UPF0700 family)
MIRHHRSERLFAVGLAGLGGYVDAVGFIALGGFFVSFMSGNSTRLSVGLAGNSMSAAIAAGLIAAFVAGVVLGSWIGRSARRRPTAVLLLVASLLALAALSSMFGTKRVAMAVAACAMGSENTIFERDGEVSIGVTYMTGTLVKFGQHLTTALSGGPRTTWLPYLLLWLGLVSGAVCGAFTYPRLGLEALWIASIVAVCLAVAALKIDMRGPDGARN